MTADQELNLSYTMAAEMWFNLIKINESMISKSKKKRLIPKKDAYWQMMGNHDDRAYKRIAEKLPELASNFSLGNFYEFKDVNSHKDAREPLKIDDQLIATHGFKTKNGAHVKEFNTNVVFGHIHRAWIHYETFHLKAPLFEMACGYLGDPYSKAMSYSSTTWSKWQHAVGIIDIDGPRLITF